MAAFFVWFRVISISLNGVFNFAFSKIFDGAIFRKNDNGANY
jgi:hypothetical protein